MTYVVTFIEFMHWLNSTEQTDQLDLTLNNTIGSHEGRFRIYWVYDFLGSH